MVDHKDRIDLGGGKGRGSGIISQHSFKFNPGAGNYYLLKVEGV